MISQNDNDVALPVLRKYDPQCKTIIDSCNKVKLYNYDKTKNAWVIKDESEGAFYLVKRNIPPNYKFVILSKYNKPGSHLSTTEIPLSQYLISQTHDTFYMFKNEFGIIQAILFPNKPDCERFCIKVDRIIKELKNESDKILDLSSVNCKPRFVESIEGILSNKISSDSPINGNDKILTMLESARQRYEDVHVEKYSRQIDIKELFKSTTSANIDASTSVMVDSMSSYTQPSQIVSNRMKNMETQSAQNRSSIPSIRNIPESVDQTLSRNGPNTLTVTELEKYLVQNASSNPIKPDVDDDDDCLLLGPNKFEGQDSPLNKEQLKEAMIYLLQNDESGNFVTQLHAAYLLSHKRTTARK